MCSSDLVEANLAALAGEGAPPPPAAALPPASAPPPPSPAAELAAIFRSIGARETSEAGLDALARFVAAAPRPPGLNLGPHLAKTSPLFRAYIAAGLARAAARLGLGPLPPCGVEGLGGAAAAVEVAPAPVVPAAVPPPQPPPTSLESLRARLAAVRLAGRASVGGGGGGGALPAAVPAPAPAATTEALHARMQALRREGGR